MFFKRQTEGSVLCPSCGKLVGVNDEECLNCGRKNPAMWGFASAIRSLGADFGFVQLVMTACVGLYVGTLLIDMSNIGYEGILSFLSPSNVGLILFGASGAIPVFSFGRWWTFLSAGWLHGSVLHLLFNMYMVRFFAGATAELYGPGRTVIIYTVSSVTGFVFSTYARRLIPNVPFLGGADLTEGASAAIFGLLGAVLYYGKRTGQQRVEKQMISYAVFIAIFGLVVQHVDNQAHLGGFVGGYYVARFLDPLEPERGDHLTIAFVCLVLTAISIIASLVTGIRLLG